MRIEKSREKYSTQNRLKVGKKVKKAKQLKHLDFN